jgi:hypothetical protein
MTALIFCASAVAAGLVVFLLTWRKAGISRTMLAAGIGMVVGVAVAIIAVAQTTGQDLEFAFAPSELLAAFTGVFIAASYNNRRLHALQLEREKQQKA